MIRSKLLPYLLLAVLVLLTTGCGTLPQTNEIISTPIPDLTPTPSAFQNAVSDIAKNSGIDKQVFLGLTGEDWINLGISILIFLVGTFFITRIVHALLRWITGFTSSKRDDEFVAAIKGQINLFISVLIFDFATGRLPFIHVYWKAALNQVYFALYVFAITWILWKLIDLGFTWHKGDTVPEGEVDASESLRILFKRLLYGLLLIVAITVILNNFGVNVTILLALLVIGIIAIFLAAQDTLTDMVYGFILLFDQPFRVGDRIEIQELGTWGDIIQVGARTTRIRTRDNRVVIMPNSIIGKNQVTNYSYPDPHYRIQTEIDIEYGNDPERVSQVIVEAVQTAQGVLQDKEVDTLVMKIGKSGLKFRVRWWIDTYSDANFVFDRVHRVLYAAFEEAGIEMSLDAYDLNVSMKAENQMENTSDPADRGQKGK
ncbi:MAG: mechanosensitive ion channel family protein [Anaerolineales bacterium]